MKQNYEASCKCLKWGGEGVDRGNGSDLTNVQFKPIQNCHNESSLYNTYILIKMGGKNPMLNSTGD
jgi:hypothetical protein